MHTAAMSLSMQLHGLYSSSDALHGDKVRAFDGCDVHVFAGSCPSHPYVHFCIRAMLLICSIASAPGDISKNARTRIAVN